MRAGSTISQRGISLIELMISMAIGLVMVAAIFSAFLSNLNNTRSTVAVARIQESARFAFEYLARDIREAGSQPCGSQIPIANVLNQGGTNPQWAGFTDVLRGFDGDTAASGASFVDSTDPVIAGKRVLGTDALMLAIVSGRHFSIESHNPSSAQFKLNESGHDLVSGDVVFVCDYTQGSIFQVTNANQSNATIVHNTGTGSPGNCTKGLGVPVDCTSTNGTAKTFEKNGILAKIDSVTWYVGCNGRSSCDLPAGRSLYFTYLKQGVLYQQDLMDGVTDMQIRYLVRSGNNYQVASSAVNWSNVIAVELTLTFGEDKVGIGNGATDVRRSFSYVVAMRGRL